MTVTSQTARSGPYNGNGSSTSFSYTFRVDLEGELVVVLADDNGTETTQTLTTHYTVTAVGNAAGGTIEMVTAPASGETLVILRSVTKQQTIDLQNRKAVIPQVLEDGLDEVTRIVQDMSETLDRVPTFSPTYAVTSVEFPQASAGSAIGWNATADGLANLSGLPTAGITASTDNAVMRYDASTGGMQDSGVTISDAGSMNFANGWEISGTAVTATAAELNILDGVTATATELNYVDGVTSAIQTQLDTLDSGKEDVDAEILRADTDDNVTGGYTATSDDDGTKSSGTYTPDPAGGNFKHIINGGAFTLAAPTATGCYTMVIEVANNASAGAITFSGFDKEAGDTLTTTDGDDFQLVITKSNAKVSVTKLDVS